MSQRACDKKGYCDMLVECFTEPNRKGINLVQTANLEGGPVRVVGVAFKKTERDRGVFFNHCPFCCTDISPELPKKKRKSGSPGDNHDVGGAI